MATEVKGSIVGRCVWGNPGKSKNKIDMDTKQPILKDGVPVQQWAFGLAFNKAEFERVIWPAMQSEAAFGYPSGVPSNFAWKYNDGDGVDSNGKPFSAREGYAGCYILNVTTEAFPPPIYVFENGAYRTISGDQVKTGDYFAIDLNLQVNVPKQRTHTPGLYVNPNGLLFFQAGPEIFNGPDAETMFGGGVTSGLALPPGAPIMELPQSQMPGAQPQQQPMQPQPQQQPMQPQPQQQPMQPQPQQQPMQPQPQQQPMQPQPQQQPMQPQPQQQPMQPPPQQQPMPGTTPPPQQQQPMPGTTPPPQQQQPMPGTTPPPATGFVDANGNPMQNPNG